MPRFSDQQLIQIIQKAARRINRRLNLFGTDCEISVDSSGSISPSNGEMEDLVLLQAECMLSGRDFVYDLNSGAAGIAAVDGEQRIDTRGVADARSSFFNSKYGPCAELEQAIKLELLKRGGGCGEMPGIDVW